MTYQDFVAWIRGVDAALNGAPPSVELWRQVVDEAARISLPTPLSPLPAPSTACSKCGLKPEGPMGYVCPRFDCPFAVVCT